MTKQLIGIGAAPNDGTGDNLRTAFGKANANFNELYSAVEQLGLSRPPILGFAGDSIAGQFGLLQSLDLSPIGFALYALAHRDVIYDKTAAATDGSGGYDFSVGGSPSSYLITNYLSNGNALAKLQAKAVKPDILFVQSIQNDAMSGNASSGDGFVQNVKTFVAGALAAGVGLVVICPRPPYNGQVGANVPQTHQHVNNSLAKYARDTTGVVFLDYIPLIKAISDANENNGASSKVAYRGSTVTGDYSGDGVHPSTLSSRAIAPLVVPFLEQYCPPARSRVDSFAAWHDTNYPYNNLYGRNGLMVGTGGQYNGVNNANVAGSAQSNGSRWTVTDTAGNGVTLTPSLITHEDGFPRQRLTLGGTASADGSGNLTFAFFSDVTSALFHSEAMIDFTNVLGLVNWRFFIFNSTALDVSMTTSQLGAVNDKLFLRTFLPRTLSNSGSSNKAITLNLFWKAGATPSGTIDVGRVGTFKAS